MIGLAPEIFQQSRTLAASSVPRHFLIHFFSSRSPDASARVITRVRATSLYRLVMTPLVTSCLL